MSALYDNCRCLLSKGAKGILLSTAVILAFRYIVNACWFASTNQFNWTSLLLFNIKIGRYRRAIV